MSKQPVVFFPLAKTYAGIMSVWIARSRELSLSKLAATRFFNPRRNSRCHFARTVEKPLTISQSWVDYPSVIGLCYGGNFSPAGVAIWHAANGLHFQVPLPGGSPILFSWRVNGHCLLCVKREWGFIISVIRESFFFRPRETGFRFFRDPGNMHLLSRDLWTSDFCGNYFSLFWRF